MPRKNINPKSKQSEAERAAEWYAVKVCGCVITRRAIRTKYQKIDFFGADVVGKRSDGTVVYVQATAGQRQAVSYRKKKMAGIPWNSNETVQVAELIWLQDPQNARRKKWYFRIYDFAHNKWLILPKAVPIEREWFTSYQNSIKKGVAQWT